MANKRKKKLNVKTRTADLIIDEAERLIGDHGMDGLRLDDISDVLGIQRPSLYTHFKGREGIITAIAERAFIELSHQFQDDNSADPEKTIRNGVYELVKFLREHKAYALLLARDFSTPGGLPAVNAVLGPTQSVVVPAILKPLYERLDLILGRGCQSGKFRQVDSFTFLTILLGSIIACLLQHRQKLDELEILIAELALGLLLIAKDTA